MTQPARKPADRVLSIAAGAFVLGLLSWYLGASTAIDRTLDTSGSLIAACAIGAAALVGSLLLEASLKKAALGNAAFAAVSLAFLAFNTLALVNVHADGSSPRDEPATFVTHFDANKGPRMARFVWRTHAAALQARHASDCVDNTPVVLELRAGALGAPWIERVRCH